MPPWYNCTDWLGINTKLPAYLCSQWTVWKHGTFKKRGPPPAPCIETGAVRVNIHMCLCVIMCIMLWLRHMFCVSSWTCWSAFPFPVSCCVFDTVIMHTLSGAVSDCNDVIGSLERGTKTWVGRLVSGTWKSTGNQTGVGDNNSVMFICHWFLWVVYWHFVLSISGMHGG